MRPITPISLSIIQTVKLEVENEVSRRSQFDVISMSISSVESKIDRFAELAGNQRSRINSMESNTPNMMTHPFKYFEHKAMLQLERQFYMKYISKLQALRRQKQVLESSIRNFDKSFFIRNFENTLNWLYINFLKYWVDVLIIIILILIGRPFWAVFCYFIIAPFTKKVKPLKLFDSHNSKSTITFGESLKNITLKVKPNERIICRMEWLQKHQGNAILKSRIFWSWSSPLISYAAGLFFMTEI
ncbi:hypothetical protein QUF70_18975 [Desulfobacterales bacterium HSG17]|nr:hypothetical protein [Desulfobacterales bacterium HSG17]